MFEIKPEQITDLDDSQLRELVGRLCESEVRAKGHSPAAITWGGHQNAGDGGIDVRVAVPAGSQISGYIPAANTGFQVKAEDMPRQKILDEMSPEGTLRPSIADLAAKGGAYVIVSSKGSTADGPLEDRKTAMGVPFAKLSPPTVLKTDFYDRRRLASWVNQHPGIVAWVRELAGQPIKGWRPFADWSSSPLALDKPYVLDEKVRLIGTSIAQSHGLSPLQGINTLREILAKPKGIVRLVGLSGVGKTRLIQALFDDRIGNNPLPRSDAIYTDISDSPEPVPLELLSQLLAAKQRAIMIVDNCGTELHRKLAGRMENAGGQINLITVEYDINDDEPESTDVFKLEPGSTELIEKVLEERYPEIAGPSRSVIAKFSDGNARVAFALAATAKNGESLVNLKDKELFKRLFEQSKNPSEELLNAAKVCALLYSFDGETLEGLESELTALASLAGITTDKLYTHVAELHRRQLLQKRGKWRAILPHALAHRLAKLALEDIPFGKIEAVVHGDKSGRMLKSFSRRMGYLHDEPRVVALVSKWLGKGGLLESLGKLSDLEEEILENIAPVDPEKTLAYFESAAATDPKFLTGDNENVDQIVRVARSIAYDPELFDRSVELMRRFALAKTDDTKEVRVDPLKSLFSIHLSGTHATPQQRAAFVKKLFESESEAEQELGASLLEAMLQTDYFSSSHSFEFGARKRDFGLSPHTGQEVHDWFVNAMDAARAGASPGRAVARRVRRTIASHLRGLLMQSAALDEAIALADELAADGGWGDGWIGVRSTLRRDGDGMPPAIRKKVEQLESRLSPQDLAASVRSYALSPQWGSIDIADLEEDSDTKPTEAEERISGICCDLGKKLALDAAQFPALLPEILACETTKTFSLGKGVAAACPQPMACWNQVRDTFLQLSQQRRYAQFLAGFIVETMTRDAAASDAILDDVLARSELHPYLVYLQTWAGVGGNGFERLMKGLEFETVPVAHYAFLSNGRAHEALDDSQLEKLIDKILARDGLNVATEIIGMRIFGLRSDKLEVGETLRAISRNVLRHVKFEREEPRSDHRLAIIVQAAFAKPEHEPDARAFCEALLESIRNHRLCGWRLNDTLAALAKVAPISLLDILVEKASESRPGRSVFRDGLNEQKVPLNKIPPAALLAWAAQKPQTRYTLLAQVVRFAAAGEEHPSEWSEVARGLIEVAPQPVEVLNEFLTRFRPSGGRGSTADTMAGRMPLIDELTNHSRPEVVAWAAANRQRLIEMIAKERKWEADLDRQRDESFE